MNATGQVVWSFSTRGDITASDCAQRWWENLTGQSLDEQQRENAWLAMLHPDDRTPTAETWRDALASGTPYDITFRVRSKTLEWRYVRACGCPNVNEHGTIRQWVGTLEDVTAQFAANLEAAKHHADAVSEKRQLEEVFQHAPSFMAVLRGPKHVFERINDRYAQLVGERKIIGLPVSEALPEVISQGYIELLDRVYQTGIPHTEVNANVTLMNREGPVNKSVEFVYQPIFDSDGTVTGVIVQGIDLTKRREAEEGLVQATADKDRLQRMYETALSHTADFVYMFDTSGRFTYVNKALLDLWGRSWKDAVGKNFHDLEYPYEIAAKLQRQIQQVINTGLPVRDETNYTSAAGTEAYEYIFMPVLGPHGAVDAVAGSTRQISERKRSEELVQASEQRHRALVTATSDRMSFIG